MSPRDYGKELTERLRKHFSREEWTIEIRIAFFDGFHVYFTYGKGHGLSCARLGIHVKQMDSEPAMAAWIAHAWCVLELAKANGGAVESFFGPGEAESARSEW